MSKASEWAKMHDARPAYQLRGDNGFAIDFSVSQDGGSMTAFVPTPRSVFSEGLRITIRAEGAVDLARWILDTFGDDTSPTPAQSGR